MNKTYVVVSLYLSGKGKKIWQSGDVVSPSDFDGNFEKLIQGGYIKQIEKEETKKESDLEPLFVVDREGEKVEIFTVKDIHKPEIVALLTEKGVEFDESDRKADLWELLVK